MTQVGIVYNMIVNAKDGIDNVAKSWSWTISPPTYDVNADGIVDILDIVIVGQHFGLQTCYLVK